jgi:hypothetical protein
MVAPTGIEPVILGAPGAGKTTLLPELTEELLDDVGNKEGASFPVVFNLNSWAEVRKPLQQWIAQEMKRLYDCPLDYANYLKTKRSSRCWTGSTRYPPRTGTIAWPPSIAIVQTTAPAEWSCAAGRQSTTRYARVCGSPAQW